MGWNSKKWWSQRNLLIFSLWGNLNSILKCYHETTHNSNIFPCAIGLYFLCFYLDYCERKELFYLLWGWNLRQEPHWQRMELAPDHLLIFKMDDGAGVFAWCVGWLKNLFESFIVESILSTYNIHYTRYVFKRFSTPEDMNTTIKKTSWLLFSGFNSHWRVEITMM